MTELEKLDRRLRDLRDDRSSGAVDLALKALGIANDWIADGRPPDELAAEFKIMHPAIATVANVATVLGGTDVDLPARLTDLRVSLVEGNRRIADKLRKLIPASSSVITISNSSTIRESLLSIGAASVYVLKSHPGGEGAAMAEALREGFAKLREESGTEKSSVVHLGPDTAMGNIVPLVNCALVGIDTFDATGAVVHKVGTLPLALCCNHFGKPFYAAGHSLKFSNREPGGLPEPEKSLTEQFFDRTPPELITQIITEQED